MKKPDFLHVDTNSFKSKVNLKVLIGCGHKWACPLWSQDSKIGLYLIKKLILYTGFGCVGINSGKFKITLIIEP